MTGQEPVGVIFDLDGVLIDSAELHFESWQRMAREYGTSLGREQFHATFGRQNRDVIRILFGDVSDSLGLEMANRKEALYRNLVGVKPPIVAGAVELVLALARVGASLALGSSAPRENIDLILGAMGISHLISVVVSGNDVVRGKPDPQVFSLACAGLKLPPRRCVVIEDAPAGIEAARRAGTKTVAVLIHHDAQALSQADVAVARLADVTIEEVLLLARR